MVVSALEIGQNYLRALRLSQRGATLVVAQSAQVQLEEGLINSGVILNREKFTNALNSFLKTNHFSSVHWIVSLPCKAVFTTYKIFPNLSGADLDEAVQLNIQSLLPGQSEEISWGFQEVEPLEKISGKEVMVSSIPKKILTSYLKVFSQIGIIPNAIEPKSLSISRVVGKTAPTLILDIEGLNITSVIVSNGFVRFAREFQIVQTPKDQFKSLIFEIRRAMNFYLTENHQEKIENIIVDGPGATKELMEALSKTLSIPVKTAHDILKISAPSLGIFGAAIRALTPSALDNSLSLMPVGVKQASEEKRTLLFYGGIANIFVITSILILLLFFATFGFLKYLSKKADLQLAGISEKAASEDQTTIEKKQQIKDINAVITPEASIEDQINFFSNVLSNIIAQKGPDITLTNIDYSKEGEPINLTGKASLREALVAFRDALQNQSFIESVQMPTTNFSQNQNISFTMILKIKKDALKRE